jgi:hypothetical protein
MGVLERKLAKQDHEGAKKTLCCIVDSLFA